MKATKLTMDIGTTLNISRSVNRSDVVQLLGQLLWPVSSLPVCGVSGCQKVQFWHKYPCPCGVSGMAVVMWLENDSPVKTFSSQNKERSTLLGLDSLTGHTSLLAMRRSRIMVYKGKQCDINLIRDAQSFLDSIVHVFLMLKP